MKIVLLGTGNVAGSLGTLFLAAGHQIVQVYGRNSESSNILANKLRSSAVQHIAAVSGGADLYIIAISDDSIPSIASQFLLKSGMVVHTAGSVSREVLAPISDHYGVLYPLQSLKGSAGPVTGKIPFLLDANNEKGLVLLKDLIRSSGGEFQVASDNQRLQMHLAAVWVNNFSNLLYTIAYDICRKNGLEFHLLLPLIRETALRLTGNNPMEWQTGPAIRGDIGTMERHLALMAGNQRLQQLYVMLSEVISGKQVINQ